jgi:hypothetical protein
LRLRCLGLAGIKRDDSGADELDQFSDRRPVCYMLHKPIFPRFCGVLAVPPESLQTPDSSPESAFRIAPVFSAKLAGPPFDYRVPTKKPMILPSVSVEGVG